MTLKDHIIKHFKSYKNAIVGFDVLKKETNFWAEMIILFIIIATVLVLKIALFDSVLLFVVWTFLVGAEALNTAIELMADIICEKHSKNIAKVKDVSALGVLLVAGGLFALYLYVVLKYAVFGV